MVYSGSNKNSPITGRQITSTNWTAHGSLFELQNKMDLINVLKVAVAAFIAGALLGTIAVIILVIAAILIIARRGG